MVVLEFDTPNGLSAPLPVTMTTSPLDTVLSAATDYFEATAMIQGGSLWIDKTPIAGPPPGNYGVSPYWGPGLGGSGGSLFVKFECPPGETFECFGAAPVACTGAPQVLQASGADTFSCGLGKQAGTTRIYWVISVH